MIEVSELSARIGAVDALSGVSFSLAPGRLLTVIGANGAGKTTLLRAVSNVLPRSGGTVRFDGQDTDGVSAYVLARTGLVQAPQGRQIVPNLSVHDNLLLGAAHLPNTAETERRLEAEYARFPVLLARQNVAGGSLSGGEQQMLALSRALMMRPKLLMLDEPSLGLAPQVARGILHALRTLADEGMAVLLVEQMALGALAVADRALVLRNGHTVVEASAADLRRDRALVESYLG